MTPEERKRYAINAASSRRWTEEEVAWLVLHYPVTGKMACAEAMGRTEADIRYKASHLKLRINRESEFFREFQQRAAASKIGKKRPQQAAVLAKLHADGRLAKTPEQREAISVRTRKWIRDNGHQRGALGMRHTPSALSKIAAASRKQWDGMSQESKVKRAIKISTSLREGGHLNKPHGSWKAAWREIGGKRAYFRSRWEANYARYLEWLKTIGNITEREHEPETFWFTNIRRGVVSYLPDFRVTNPSGSVEYHEVKGWMDDRSKTKIKRMAKYYPAVKLIVIDSKSYKKLASQIAATISGWE